MDPETGSDMVGCLCVSGKTISGIVADAHCEAWYWGCMGKPSRSCKPIDVSGLVIAPGFIDLHAHGQDDDSHSWQALDGVTTALELEVGVYPVSSWLKDRAAEGGARVNYGASVGHIPARMKTMDDRDLDGALFHPKHVASKRKVMADGRWASEAASAKEVGDLTGKLRAEMASSGALGIGFGVAYTAAAEEGEIQACFDAAAEAGMPAFIHVREAGRMAAFEEAVRLAERSGAAMHIAHLGSSGLKLAPRVMGLLRAANAADEEAAKRAEAEAAATVVVAALGGKQGDSKENSGTGDGSAAAVASEAAAAAAAVEAAAATEEGTSSEAKIETPQPQGRQLLRLPRVTTEVYPYAAGCTRIESKLFEGSAWMAREGGVGYGDLQWAETGEYLTEETFKKYRAEGGLVIIHSQPKEVVAALVEDPEVMIASDGIPFSAGPDGSSRGHPRGAGTFARALGWRRWWGGGIPHHKDEAAGTTTNGATEHGESDHLEGEGRGGRGGRGRGGGEQGSGEEDGASAASSSRSSSNTTAAAAAAATSARLDLMQTLTKMTWMPAARLESMSPAMKRKGRVRVGFDADLTVFDPAHVVDRSTYLRGARPSQGIVHVLVNGAFVVKSTQLVPSVRPGVAITSNATFARANAAEDAVAVAARSRARDRRVAEAQAKVHTEL